MGSYAFLRVSTNFLILRTLKGRLRSGNKNKRFAVIFLPFLIALNFEMLTKDSKRLN